MQWWARGYANTKLSDCMMPLLNQNNHICLNGNNYVSLKNLFLTCSCYFYLMLQSVKLITFRHESLCTLLVYHKSGVCFNYRIGIFSCMLFKDICCQGNHFCNHTTDSSLFKRSVKLNSLYIHSVEPLCYLCLEKIYFHCVCLFALLGNFASNATWLIKLCEKKKLQYLQNVSIILPKFSKS